MSEAPSPPVYRNVDRARFEREIVARGRPAILKGLVADWDWVRASRESGDGGLLALLRALPQTPEVEAFLGAPAMKGRFHYGEDFRSFNFERHRLPFGDLLEILENARGVSGAPHIYAGAVRLHAHFPEALSALAMPLLDRGVERLTSLWIGNASRTAPHWDLPQNLACVVAGRRTFRLFPIDQVANLYVGPLDFTLAGQPVSLCDPENPDFERFPKFRDAMATMEIAELEPGDALYLPSLCVHHVANDAPLGAMVNFWWRDGPAHLTTPFQTLMHGLLTIRDLPEAERARWRGLFDHFLFQTNGDPQPHLPDAAKGVFGEATPERLAAIRALLVRSLSR